MKELETPEMNKLYKEFGNDFVKVLTKELISSSKSATGNLIKSLSPDLKTIGDKINIIINGEDYLQYVDQGRKPGSYPPISVISKWATIKGISQDAVFPIARKIFKFGIKPTNVIEKTLNELNPSITLLESKMANVLETTLANEFQKEVNKK